MHSLIGIAFLALSGASVAQFTTTEGYHCESSGLLNWTHTLSTSIQASTGKRLSGIWTFTATDTTYTVRHGDDLVYTRHGYGTADNVTTDITFGPKSFNGVANMLTKYVPSQGLLTGSIDGRAIAPFKKAPQSAIANEPKMADGRAAPVAKQIANLTAEDFQSLEEKAKSIPKTCGEATTFPKPTRDLQARDILLRRGDGLDRSSNHGYRPDTYGNGPCKSCLVSVTADLTLAGLACTYTLGFCAISFGVSCAICWATALGIAYEHQKLCLQGPCCPVACGEVDFWGVSQCCLKGETCLNSDPFAEVCCKKDEKTCGKDTCCHGTQQCIVSQSGRGTCCPAEATCNGGKSCCRTGSKCLNGDTCCPVEKMCGKNCCKDNGPFLPGYCANQATGLCCTGNQVEVNGICCPPGNKNVDGKCVDPRGKCGESAECSLTNDHCPARYHCNYALGCCDPTIF